MSGRSIYRSRGDRRLTRHTLVVESRCKETPIDSEQVRMNSEYKVLLHEPYYNIRRIDLVEYVIPNSIYPVTEDTRLFKFRYTNLNGDVHLLQFGIDKDRFYTDGAQLVAEMQLRYNAAHDSDEGGIRTACVYEKTVAGTIYHVDEHLHFFYNEYNNSIQIRPAVTVSTGDATNLFNDQPLYVQPYDSAFFGAPDPLENAAIISWTPAELSTYGSIETTPLSALNTRKLPYMLKLMSHPHLVLSIKEFGSTGQTLQAGCGPLAGGVRYDHNAFAMISIDSAAGSLCFFKEPIVVGDLDQQGLYSRVIPDKRHVDMRTQISIRLTTPDGKLVDFNGVDHILVFAIWTDNEDAK